VRQYVWLDFTAQARRLQLVEDIRGLALAMLSRLV
jgi:hypothetical protein